MRRRQRKRAKDPAIAALARELLEAGELLRHTIRPHMDEEARLLEARFAAQSAGYLVGVTYCDAITARRNALGAAAQLRSGKRYLEAIDRAAKFRAIIDTAGGTLRADAGDE